MNPRERLMAALEIGLEHTQTVLSRHDVDLGRTTHSNKAEAETLEDELKQIHDVIALVKQIAIGRWVSVEERLPPCRFMGDVIHTNFGQGIFIVDQKTGEHGTFMNRVCSAGCHIKTDITHWLDISLPGGKEEA